MRYFIDTEFIERPNTIDMISIGIKCEDGRKYYALSSDFNYYSADDWVKKNVIDPAYLETVHGDLRNTLWPSNFNKHFGKSISTIKKDLLEFIGDDPEFWGYYCDYDWVVFCWIFGKMIDLPDGYPMYCRDLKQLMDEWGNDSIPSPEGEHNALVDAEWNEELYHYLMKRSG